MIKSKRTQRAISRSLPFYFFFTDLAVLLLDFAIMHGKELAYDSLAVDAKTWALLFAVRDWIVVRRKPKPKEKAAMSIQESLEELEKIRETNQLLDK